MSSSEMEEFRGRDSSLQEKESPAITSMDFDSEVDKVDKSEAGTADNSNGSDFAMSEETEIHTPCVGMEFDSDDAAKSFYNEYSRRSGFIMRVDQCRRSEVDRSIISRRFSCNKQGFYIQPRKYREAGLKQRTSAREGCNAMMLVKINSAGKWVVTRFEKEHTHSLSVPDPHSLYPSDSKDKRIQALTLELKRQNQLCDLYRQELIALLEYLEGQTQMTSTNILKIVHHLKDFEAEHIQDQDILDQMVEKKTCIGEYQ